MLNILFYDIVTNLFYGLFFLVPLIFYPQTSEVFEFNKIVVVYIFTALIVAFWIITMINKKRIIFRRTLLDIPLLLFLGSQIISTVFSIDQRTSIFGYYSRFNGGLLSTVCYALLYWAFVSNFTKQNSQKLIKITLVSATIFAIYGILEHFGGSISCLFVTGHFNNNCWVQDVQNRVFATLGQPNWLAAALISLAPLSWSIALKQTKNKKGTAIWIGVSILFFACILFTKSRSGLLGLAAAYVIFWIFNFRRHFKLFLLTSALFLVVVGIFGIPFRLPGFTGQAPMTQVADQGEGGTESGAIREIVWKGAIDISKHYPLFGSGVETFGYSYWQFRPAEHNNTSEWDFLYNKAHNEYLNFAANTGIIGLGTYLIFIGSSIYVMRKNHALLAGFSGILITNFFGFSVVVISLFTFLFPAIAVVLNTKKGKNNDSFDMMDGKQKLFVGGIIAVTIFILFLVGRYWYSDYLYNKSRNDLSAKAYTAAFEDLQKAIDYSPKEAIYYNQMSRFFTTIATNLNEGNEATSAAKIVPYALGQSDKAFELSPRNMNVRETRISMYLELAQFDPKYFQDGINLIKETIKLSPTDPKLHLLLGRAYANSGQISLSIEELKKSLQLKPDYENAKTALETVEKLQKTSK